MKVLQDRFRKPELLVKSQINKIRNVAPILESRIEQLVGFATKVQNLSSFQQAADCDHHLSNPTLMEELLLKLPIQRRIEWARYALSIVPRPTICHFSDWLQELSSIVNSACVYSSLEPRQNRPEGRSRFFHANEASGENSGRIRCEACADSHTITKCRRFLNMEHGDRWRLVRRKKLCFNCLKGSHRSNNCGEEHERGDRHCTKRWHVLLHESCGRAQQWLSAPLQQASQPTSRYAIQQTVTSTSEQAVQQKRAAQEAVQQVFASFI
ncbi:PREDICTED: uncharacterized protein LOC108361378 [Rhagoletis zephyria]|uniref:uncharacterized protein LOC108361378 n=1 Tax=Rhagoletis zephyria TaxID=28612 RepID=UPI000811711A|nr:PREDICTED: uncharacterized protein LOC108361378 [Rhagoletis zephyria]XP_036318549.1 uncharacterized protein LOC118733303 [Rhagoletis pomonella]